MITLPGLIDIHVHLRDPGQIEKEDFYTGTSAALAGGFTKVIDMPNNKTPITTFERLKEKMDTARGKAVCDIGFYFGSLGENIEEFGKVKNLVLGIKVYLNLTTGHYLVGYDKFENICGNWTPERPVLVHSEEETVDLVLKAVKKTGHKVHFCHVSSAYEVSKITEAKDQGLPVTCGVSPHYLFLTQEDVTHLKSFAMMKPPLKTKKDREYLWKHLDYIDVVESDHAPHTVSEKKSDTPPFGIPGLETTLSLLLTAEHEGKITREKVISLCFENPKKILGLKDEVGTRVEVNEATYEVRGKDLKSKCKWTPFEGWKLKGRVERVYIRGKKVYEDGKVTASPGSGHLLVP